MNRGWGMLVVMKAHVESNNHFTSHALIGHRFCSVKPPVNVISAVHLIKDPCDDSPDVVALLCNVLIAVMRDLYFVVQPYYADKGREDEEVEKGDGLV